MHCLSHLSLYVAKQLTHSSVPHTATVQLAWLSQCSTNDILRFLVKAQPSTQSTAPRSLTGHGRETWAYSTNTVLATVAFLLPLHTNLLSQAGITHYSQLLTLQHTTKLLLCKKVDLSLYSKFWSPHEGFHKATNLIINTLLDANADRKLAKSPILRTVNYQNWLFAKV